MNEIIEIIEIVEIVEMVEMRMTARGPRFYFALCVILQSTLQKAVALWEVQTTKRERYEGTLKVSDNSDNSDNFSRPLLIGEFGD